jgi:hypothetical protein
MAIDATKSTLAAAAVTTAPSPTKESSSTGKGATPPGAGEGKSTISGAVFTASRSLGSYAWSALTWLPRTLYKGFWTSIGWAADKIWGPGRIPAKTIDVEVKNWTWGTSVQKMNLDTALEKKLITPQQALEKHYCNKEYLTARGWDIVKFNYKNWRGAEYPYEGKLRSAVRDGYITAVDAVKAKFISLSAAINLKWIKIEDAINAKLITKEEAVKAKLLKAEKPVK